MKGKIKHTHQTEVARYIVVSLIIRSALGEVISHSISNNLGRQKFPVLNPPHNRVLTVSVENVILILVKSNGSCSRRWKKGYHSHV